MKILIVNNTAIPAFKYGGTERVIWGLGKYLVAMGHEVTFLVAAGSSCPFAKVLVYNPSISLEKQIPADTDVVHIQFQMEEKLSVPYITTYHGNNNHPFTFDFNTVFISHNQAKRYHGNCVVYNGLDWNDYGKPQLTNQRRYVHFLANAAWKVKNVKGAIAISKMANEKLYVLGGHRFNFNMGIRLTFDTHVRFKGMVGGNEKNNYLQGSKAMIFPVLWHEPFGLAIIESLYFGCPVFGTTYGSLPELIVPQVGFTSNSMQALAEALKESDSFSRKACHDYAVENFNAQKMAEGYIALYQKVMNGEKLHTTAPYFGEEDIQKEKRLPMQP